MTSQKPAKNRTPEPLRSLSARANLVACLARGTRSVKSLADRAARHPMLVSDLFAGLTVREARLKFGCAKVLMLASERTPQAVLPHWARLLALLKSDNKIMQWSAMLTLANLSSVASLRRARALVPQLLATVRGPVMITAANAMRSAARIALAHRSLADLVAREILQVENARYQTSECRNIAISHAVLALEELWPILKDRGSVLAMAKRATANSHPATRKKATAFLKKHDAQRKPKPD